MPRVHFVKKARKDNPVCKAGESYYWWKFRYGGKHYSLTPPSRSQLTQSEFLGQVYSIEDQLSTFSGGGDDLEEFLGEIETLREECEDKLNNMPESLQYSPTGELLQERIDGCESWYSELDSLRDEAPEHPDELEEPDPCDYKEGEDDDDYLQACDDHQEKVDEYEEWLERIRNEGMSEF